MSSKGTNYNDGVGHIGEATEETTMRCVGEGAAEHFQNVLGKVKGFQPPQPCGRSSSRGITPRITSAVNWRSPFRNSARFSGVRASTYRRSASASFKRQTRSSVSARESGYGSDTCYSTIFGLLGESQPAKGGGQSTIMRGGGASYRVAGHEVCSPLTPEKTQRVQPSKETADYR